MPVSSLGPTSLRPLDRPEPLAEQVAAALRDAIVTGKLPSGTRLSVPEMARRLSVSRTPAREGLLILEREGLIGRGNGTSMRVLVGNVEQLVELLEMREVLEGLAARRAADRMDAARIERLDKLIQRHFAVLKEGGIDDHVEEDANFHRFILEIAASGELTAQLERIDRIVLAMNRALSGGQGFDPRAVEADHSAIAEALRKGDSKAAERSARAHIRRARHLLKQTISPLPATAIPQPRQ